MAECRGEGPIYHPPGECPWCDQAQLDAYIDQKIAEAKAKRAAVSVTPASTASLERIKYEPGAHANAARAALESAASERCPTCDSLDPQRHPAMQWEGEVELCPDPWHKPTKAEILERERRDA